MAIEMILLLLVSVILANTAVAIACMIISRRRHVPTWLRVIAVILLLLDIPPMLVVLPGMFGPSQDEILGMGEGWRLLAITVFAAFLLPGVLLCWSAFRRSPSTRP